MIRRLFHRFSLLSGHKVAVLMYHRIANVETDPWQLSVSAENFEQQLRILKSKFKILTLNELINQLANKRIESNSVLLTFDDAYADNYLYAMPLLEKYGCPATFFVPTDYVEQAKSFWWDELETYILHTNSLPRRLSLDINNHHFEFELERNVPAKYEMFKQRTWIWSAEPPTERCKLYMHLWERMRPLPHEEIRRLLQQIRAWSAYDGQPVEDCLPMNVDQLREIAGHPLFTLGVHTKTHPALAYHTKEVQHKEISGSKRYLELHFNSPIHAIAYPYGNYNDTTLEVTKENGIAIGFTTEGKPITTVSDPLCLGRLQVLNWNGKEIVKQVKRLLYQG